MSYPDATFQIEAYWGICDGELLHGTIEVVADSMEEALEIAISERRIPSDKEDHHPACARPEYFEDHYDAEPIGDEFDEIRAKSNWQAVIKGRAKYGYTGEPSLFAE